LQNKIGCRHTDIFLKCQFLTQIPASLIHHKNINMSATNVSEIWGQACTHPIFSSQMTGFGTHFPKKAISSTALASVHVDSHLSKSLLGHTKIIFTDFLDVCQWTLKVSEIWWQAYTHF
jgi:hypothetical protein